MKVIVELKTVTETFKNREDAIRWATRNACRKICKSGSGYFIKEGSAESAVGYSLEKRNSGTFFDKENAVRFGSFSTTEQTGAHWVIRVTRIPVSLLKSFNQKTRYFEFKI